MISFRTLGQRGMSLVELLVAMVIGMVLLAGVYQIFIGSTNSNRDNEQFSRLQENARFAMEILGRDIRMGGYSGCANLPAGGIVNTLNDTSFLFNFNGGVQGFENTDPADGSVVATDFTPNLDGSIPLANLVEQSDVFTVRSLGGQPPIYLEAPMLNSSANLKITNGTGTGLIDVDDIVMVTDCIGSAIFQVSSYTTGTGTVGHVPAAMPGYGAASYPKNASANLGHPFVAGAEILKINTTSYMIQTNPVTGVSSLYRLTYANISAGSIGDELVQGVESMQVRYGIDTDGDRQVDSYVTADVAALDWREVVAVRVALLLQSGINARLPADTTTYDLDGDGVSEYDDPADQRRMRRVFKATFALRNRVS